MSLNITLLLLALALLLCSLACGQATQCAPAGSPLLRFVAQLSVNGCPLFVHDTGASDGPHLAVEPVMCVTDSLQDAKPRLDPITQQMYVSVPVVVRDAKMLEEAERQLRHLSPRSVSFATVTDISVSAEVNSSVHSVGFIWSPDESVGSLRIGCGKDESAFDLASAIRISPLEALDRVLLSASIKSNETCQSLIYHPMIQNRSLFHSNMHGARYRILNSCRQLRFIRTVNLENCTARVHQRLDMKGHFLIEPLLCHNINTLSSEPVKFDYSRDKHYLKLDLVLQDDTTLDAVRTQLADLAPLSVAFMRLWRAQSIVSSTLSARFEIGPLMVSADWRSAQLRVFCHSFNGCGSLSFAVRSEPVDLWRHVKWQLTSLVSNQCMLHSERDVFSWRMKTLGGAVGCSNYNSCSKVSSIIRSGVASHGKFRTLSDGRWFASIGQRVKGSVSFQRTWTEYETGFGDETDFWIGLSAIHSLSAGGATLRVELQLWNGTELHAEYAGFQVGGASTKYRMTYREMLADRSSVGWDAMEHNNGSQFSTMDADNDGRSGSCSVGYGKGGWWFNSCMHFNPNGLFPSRHTSDDAYMSWYSLSQWLPLREVSLMLQI